MSCYQDRDGRWFWLLGLEGDRHWPDLARAVGRPEWLDDPRFTTGSARRRNCTELIGLLDEIFATRPRRVGRSLRREGMWWAPVHTVDEVLADPQVHANGTLVALDHPGGAVTTSIGAPVELRGRRTTRVAAAPALGRARRPARPTAGRRPAPRPSPP